MNFNKYSPVVIIFYASYTASPWWLIQEGLVPARVYKLWMPVLDKIVWEQFGAFALFLYISWYNYAITKTE